MSTKKSYTSKENLAPWMKRESIISKIHVLQIVIYQTIRSEVNNDQIPRFEFQQFSISKLFAELDQNLEHWNKRKRSITNTRLSKHEKYYLSCLQDEYRQNIKHIIAVHLFCEAFTSIKAYISRVIDKYYKCISPSNIRGLHQKEAQIIKRLLYFKCLFRIFHARYKGSTEDTWFKSKLLVSSSLINLKGSAIIRYLKKLATKYGSPIAQKIVKLCPFK